MFGRRRAGHVEGASVEQTQQAHGRHALSVGLAGVPVANTRQGLTVNKVRADLPNSVQVFAKHPRIRNTPGDDAPVNEFVPHLPGRIPPAGWDGEMSAAAPTAGWL